MNHLTFATPRKSFWHYLVKELLVVAICAAVFLPLMFLMVFAEIHYGWPRGLGLALVLLAFAVYWAIKGYRQQEE